MKILGFPGTAWIAVLVFVTTWLQSYFGNSEANWWVPVAIAVIGGIVKALELLMESSPPAPPTGALGAPASEQPSKAARWFIGP